MKFKKCFIICWFGKLPEYFEIWLKSCEYNQDFSFLLFTDDNTKRSFPSNVIKKDFSIKEFICRAQKLTYKKVNLKKAYRICDFRPAFGELFKEELKNFDFWGYCDIDIILGKLNEYISDELLNEYDAVLNGGHMSLFRNTQYIKELYKKEGSIFNYDTVFSHDAIFAFDEITGIQRIAKVNRINAKYMIPYIDAETKYYQLRSRMDKTNPDYQAYYWENGVLLRVKLENEQLYYQKQAYIHLQKRKIEIDMSNGAIGDSFWITPTGFVNKTYLGIPFKEDVNHTNPYEGKNKLKHQDMVYKCKKIVTILKRTPYQIFVRIVQAKYGINNYDRSLEERPWEKY